MKNLAQLHIKSPQNVGEKAILKKGDDESSDCLNLPALIEQSSVTFDMGDQRLDIVVPQAWINKSYDGYVEPSLWENGIPAALLSYNINGYHNTNHGVDNDNMYAASIPVLTSEHGVFAPTVTITGTITAAVTSIFRTATSSAISLRCARN